MRALCRWRIWRCWKVESVVIWVSHLPAATDQGQDSRKREDTHYQSSFHFHPPALYAETGEKPALSFDRIISASSCLLAVLSESGSRDAVSPNRSNRPGFVSRCASFRLCHQS